MAPALARIAVAILAIGALGACTARTDRSLYGEGDGGTTHLANGSDQTIQVGCTLHLDRIVDGDWTPSGEQTLGLCQSILFRPSVNEPLFSPIGGIGLEVLTLPPGGRVDSFFVAPRDPGRWRLRYDVGLGCPDSAASVSECSLAHSVETPAFGVEELCAPEACVEEPPICAPGSVFVGDTRRFSGLPRGTDPVQILVPLNTDDLDLLAVQPVPFFPIPFPVPTAECRRDLQTEECRWVCDDATPIPPPHGY